MNRLAIADLCDAHPDVQVAEPALRDFGGASSFMGTAVTVKVFEDNALVRALLEEPGAGRVLVVDGGGSLRCALFGGALAQLACANGWHGVIVNGCIRDTREIAQLQLGVKALAAHPRRSEKGLHSGHKDRVVTFAGVRFAPGQWIYADSDGLIVSDRTLHHAPGDAIL